MDLSVGTPVDPVPMAVSGALAAAADAPGYPATHGTSRLREAARSEDHTSELQSQSLISYAVFCLKKKNITGLVRSVCPSPI